MKILSIVGARPQFIKAAPVSSALTRHGMTEFMVHTGQHYDPGMSEVFFQELEIRAPDLNLNVGSGNHADQTAAMLSGVAKAIETEKPDWVLIYGDTNSTVAGALAAAKLHVPVAHVEAGLRSFNRRMPEEINRVVADSISTLLLVPTDSAEKNLLREGVKPESIVWTGDVMFDAALQFRDRARAQSKIFERLSLNGEDYVLATIHRAENTDDPARLTAIIDGLRSVAEKMRVILPLHPRTRSRIAGTVSTDMGRIEVIDPVGFLDMTCLESKATVIATDSGGVQKEAFFHGVPCVTLRDETEWIELVEGGWNRVVPPTSAADVSQGILAARGSSGRKIQPYGDGNAAERIVEALKRQ